MNLKIGRMVVWCGNKLKQTNCKFFLAFLFLLNVPFWGIDKFTDVKQPIFNADFALALTLFSINRTIGCTALFFACFVDIMQVASYNYHFASVHDFFFSWYFAPMLNWDQFITPTLALFSITLLIYLVAISRVARLVKFASRDVGLIVVVFLMLDLLNGSLAFARVDKSMMHLNINFLGSPVFNFINSKIAWHKESTVPIFAWQKAPAFDALNEWTTSHPKKSVLIVVVESLGFFNDPVIREVLNSALRTPSVQMRWQIEIADEPFSGSTIYGELRTLCGLHGHYSRLTPLQAAGCIPHRLSLQGYDTFGLHGFSRKMFDRESWWGDIGFKNKLFGSDFPLAAASCRGAFTGVCDLELINRAVDEVQIENRLVYALTLDTHLPFNGEPLTKEFRKICILRNIPEGGCVLLSAHARLLTNLTEKLVSKSERPLVIIVGDHSPPFVSKNERSLYSKNKVPLYIMRPI